MLPLSSAFHPLSLLWPLHNHQNTHPLSSVTWAPYFKCFFNLTLQATNATVLWISNVPAQSGHPKYSTAQSLSHSPAGRKNARKECGPRLTDWSSLPAPAEFLHFWFSFKVAAGCGFHDIPSPGSDSPSVLLIKSFNNPINYSHGRIHLINIIVAMRLAGCLHSG